MRRCVLARLAMLSMALLAAHGCGPAPAIRPAKSAESTASLCLARVFSDNMVLQQQAKVPVWGWASPGEVVTVTFAGQTKRAKAGADRSWFVTLMPLKAGTAGVMTVSGAGKTLAIRNVAVGEVWLCSGQSNMGFPLLRSKGGVHAMETADYPQVRMFRVWRTGAVKPKVDCQGMWQPADRQFAGGFSAVAYFYGLELHKKLNVPIGLVEASWGGSSAESWMSDEALRSDPNFAAIMERARKHKADTTEASNKPPTAAAPSDVLVDAERPINFAVGKAVKDTTEAAPALTPTAPDSMTVEAEEGAAPVTPPAPAAPGSAPKRTSPAPAAPGSAPKRRALAENGAFPSVAYNGMLAPIIPFAIKGAIWYHGETNAEEDRGTEYRTMLAGVIRNWRELWGEGNFPFLIVQLPNYRGRRGEPSESSWAEVREAQSMAARSLPNVGMAVTIDLGDARQIHPRNKEDVARRLALVALREVYRRDVLCTGPVLESMKIRGSQVVLKFKSIGGGLVAKGGELRGFAIAGKDRVFVWAKASIEGDKVIVSSEQVPKPVAVRYGWADNPGCDLYSREGLPASPFRTDDWPRAAPPTGSDRKPD